MLELLLEVAAEGGVKPIIAVMRSQYVEVQREAGRALANLAALPATQHVVNSKSVQQRMEMDPLSCC